MNFLTCKLLIEEELDILKHDINKKSELWENGKKTAGSHASKVKENLQLNRNSEVSKKYSELIRKKIISNPLIKSFALPKIIHGIIIILHGNYVETLDMIKMYQVLRSLLTILKIKMKILFLAQKIFNLII